MQFVSVIAVLTVTLVVISAAPSAWPRQTVMRYNPFTDGEAPMISINSRAYLPPRYRNLFGTESSKIHQGSAFIPKQMSDFTGKVGALRRQTFSWRPMSNPIQDD